MAHRHPARQDPRIAAGEPVEGPGEADHNAQGPGAQSVGACLLHHQIPFPSPQTTLPGPEEERRPTWGALRPGRPDHAQPALLAA